jgi:arylsulfatase A-like enzyme
MIDPSRAQRPPSVLVVFADQLRGQDLGFAGNAEVYTPNIDALAAAGTTCEQAYANNPVCTPNRGSMLTGLYPTHHGAITNDLPMDPSVESIADRMRETGRRTAYIGKWHLDGYPRTKFTPPGDRRFGFDYWAAYNCNHEYFAPKYYLDSPQLVERDGYEPEVQTDLALSYLEELGEEDSFCLWLSWGPPHDPYPQVPDRYKALYEAEELTIPSTVWKNPDNPIGAQLDPRETFRDYYAAISALDDQLGRILASLERLGRDQDTLVVFTSDHGDMLWAHGVTKKQVPYEESICIPMIMKYPGVIPAGEKVTGVFSSIDLAPTVLGLLGAAFATKVDGQDRSEAFRNTQPAGDEALLQLLVPNPEYARQGGRPWRGIRTRRWTYAEQVGFRPWLLFDNDVDPLQSINLVDREEMFDVVRGLSDRLHARLRSAEDLFLDEEETIDYFGLRDLWDNLTLT